ncbi:MAG TPA: MFS transporter [Ktedonobacteraceae bacterium]|nr:MFS transporter [Ktedonobacteraceae bacterium]
MSVKNARGSTSALPSIVSPIAPERWVVLTAGLGMFLSTLDTGIINVALPSLGQEFHTTATSTAWSVTLYLLTLSTTILIFGRLGDRYGQSRIFLGGLLVFLLGSTLCGFAFSIETLVLFRAIQGIGAAMLQANAAALITTLVAPERRGKAIGILGVMIGLGPVLGPVAGGLLLSFLGWRWIFWINIPLCILGLWGCRHLPTRSSSNKALSLDIPGNVVFALGVLALLWGLAQWPAHGFAHLETLVPLLFAVACFVLLVILEYRVADPLLDFRHILHSSLAVYLLTILAFGATTAVAFLAPPYFLEGVLRLMPWQVGLISLSAPLGLALLARVSGGLLQKYSASTLMEAGQLIILVALGILCAFQPTWSLLILALLLLLYGVGGGIFLPANIADIMASGAKELQGTIGSIQRMVQNVGIALGTAIAAALMQTSGVLNRAALTDGFHWSWLFATGVMFLCCVCMAGVLFSRKKGA